MAGQAVRLAHRSGVARNRAHRSRPVPRFSRSRARSRRMWCASSGLRRRLRGCMPIWSSRAVARASSQSAEGGSQISAAERSIPGARPASTMRSSVLLGRESSRRSQPAQKHCNSGAALSWIRIRSMEGDDSPVRSSLIVPVHSYRDRVSEGCNTRCANDRRILPSEGMNTCTPWGRFISRHLPSPLNRGLGACNARVRQRFKRSRPRSDTGQLSRAKRANAQ